MGRGVHLRSVCRLFLRGAKCKFLIQTVCKKYTPHPHPFIYSIGFKIASIFIKFTEDVFNMNLTLPLNNLCPLHPSPSYSWIQVRLMSMPICFLPPSAHGYTVKFALDILCAPFCTADLFSQQQQQKDTSHSTCNNTLWRST